MRGVSPLPVLLLLVALLPLWPRRTARRPPESRWPAMVARHWLRFGVTSVLLLGLTGQLAAFWRVPAAFAPAQLLLDVRWLNDHERFYLMRAAAVGVGIGILLGMLVTAWRAWRGRPDGSIFGDASSVRPGPGELGWGAAVAVTAGVTEEAYFRLLLPLLATQAFGNAMAAFAGATLLFGWAHRYQGWRGVAATTVAGAGLAAGYLATGSLPAMMAFHAAGDLGHLVLRPAVRGWIERRGGG